MAEIASRQKKRPLGSPRRGEIYVVSFDPTVGHEIQKTRPALVIQNDIGNRHSPVTIVAAITSSLSRVRYPIEVVLHPSKTNGLDVLSAVRLDQIRSIDRMRLIRRLGAVDAATQEQVDTALKISLGLVEI